MGDTPPAFTKDVANERMLLNTILDLDIKCLPSNSTDGEYLHAVTLELGIDTEFDFSITYSVLIKAEIYKLDLNLIDVRDPLIDVKNKKLIQTELNLGSTILVPYINTALASGVSL